MLDFVSKPAMQRAKGRLRIGFEDKNGQSKLQDLHQAGCLKAMVPRNHASIPDVVMINTAGGLTGGDRLDVSVSVGKDARLRMATQTAERIYRSAGGPAKTQFDFSIGPGARFDWMAQETILFDGGDVQRTITADLTAQSSALFVEPVVLGRTAMGEVVKAGFFKDTWRIRRDGKLVYADAVRLHDFTALKHPAALDRNIAFATVLFVDPAAEDVCQTLKAKLRSQPVETGCSAWNGLVLTRLMSDNAAQLRQTIMNVTTFLRGQDLPRVWTM